MQRGSLYPSDPRWPINIRWLNCHEPLRPHTSTTSTISPTWHNQAQWLSVVLLAVCEQWALSAPAFPEPSGVPDLSSLPDRPTGLHQRRTPLWLRVRLPGHHPIRILTSAPQSSCSAPRGSRPCTARAGSSYPSPSLPRPPRSQLQPLTSTTGRPCHCYGPVYTVCAPRPMDRPSCRPC